MSESINKRIDILSVSFLGEIESLKLQIRSVAKFFNEQLLNKYYIIWNDTSPISDLIETIKSTPSWVVNHIVFIEGRTLCAVDSPAKGWLIQQVMKLKGLALADSEIVLVLDTKNHLISDFDIDDVYSDRGLPLVSLVNYSNKTAFKALLEGGLEYFGVSPDKEIIEQGLPTTTPYLMYSGISRGLIEAVEKREGVSFERSFLIGSLKYKSTEFLLYYSYLISTHGSLNNLYDTQPANSITFFKSSPKDAPGIKMAIGRMSHPRTKFLAIHRVRMPRLSPEEKDAFVEMWASRGIFDSREQGITYIESFI